VSIEATDIRPHEMCVQTAQSILGLAQSYDDLLTLRRVTGLLPYLICASGLFGVAAMRDSGLQLESTHLRMEYGVPMTRYEFQQHETVIEHNNTSGTTLTLSVQRREGG
jgi:hypothetical protein